MRWHRSEQTVRMRLLGSAGGTSLPSPLLPPAGSAVAISSQANIANPQHSMSLRAGVVIPVAGNTTFDEQGLLPQAPAPCASGSDEATRPAHRVAGISLTGRQCTAPLLGLPGHVHATSLCDRPGNPQPALPPGCARAATSWSEIALASAFRPITKRATCASSAYSSRMKVTSRLTW
jgi:hypothetical protein